MIVGAQIAAYPLRQERLTPAIAAVTAALEAAGLEPQPGPMSTLVTGEVAVVFRALEQGFVRAATCGGIVMTVTVSNACPTRRAAPRRRSGS
jgi:uncharacterized protein YqgV (UPF0045/DUF77 family)